MKTDENPVILNFAAITINKHLTALTAEIDGVRLGQDIENIHRMRVASRRLRTALDLFAFCFPQKKTVSWQKEVKKITQSLGAARDKDVQGYFLTGLIQTSDNSKILPGLKRVSLRLKQKREGLQKGVLNSLDELINSQTLEDLQSHIQLFLPSTPISPQPPSIDLNKLAWENILTRLQEFLSYESYIFDLNNIVEMHSMRIAAKNLRYTMEIFSPIFPSELKPYLQAARQVQEWIGTIHDCEVWISYLSGFIEKEQQKTIDFYGYPRGIRPLFPGLTYLTQNRTDTQQKTFINFSEAWEKWNEQNLWQNLVNELKAPLLD